MSTTMGYTREEIREHMHQYYLQPHGTKQAWLAEQSIPTWKIQQWRKFVYEGDLDRNLIPRDHGSMSSTYSERSAFEKARAQELAEHQNEVEKLQERIRNLEGTNDALGKAIGLLHTLNVPEPATKPTNDPERSGTFLDTENQLIHALVDFTGSERKSLSLAGVSRSTWHYRSKPRERVQNPIHQSARAYESRISEADRERISEYILAGWADNHSVDHSFATAWDDGVMLASRRTWWRLAAELEDQMLRPKVPTKHQTRQRRSEKLVLKGTGPGQIWSWDITDVYSPWRQIAFKVYSVMDIFSRQIVGDRVRRKCRIIWLWTCLKRR
ncbi:hypothetical protein [Glutamicibacter ardleyensis]|uniref:hypothetical protein n=1 Tax=Glutamicibacter ardleyensis TaxID=225894 RepID=UPI003FD4F714